MSARRSRVLLALVLAGCATTRPAPTASSAPAAQPAAAARPEPAPAGSAAGAPPSGPWVRTPPPPPLSTVPWTEPPANEATLPNGLRVVVIERHGRPIVSVRLLLRSGAASESREHAGVTWLSLALLEDREEKRTDDGELLVSDEKSARRQLAEQGGALSFGVTSDGSWLGVDGYSVDTAKYLQTLREVMKARRHGADGFAGRRDALLDAIDDLELGDDETLFEQLGRLAFGPQHVYAQRVVGTVPSLEQMGIEDVVARQDAVLQPKGATLLVVGEVDHQQVLSKAADVFEGWANTARVVEPDIPASPVGKRKAVRIIPRKPARTTALCSVRGLGDVKASGAALAIFAETMGNGRLRQALREERGFTYVAQASVIERRKARALAFCSRLPTTATAEGLRVFVHALEALKASPPTAEELDRAKATLQSRLAAERSSVAGTIESWAHAVELGQPTGLAEQQAALRAVTAAELEALSRQVLDLDHLQLVLSGDTTTIEAAVKASGLGASTVVHVAHEGGRD